MLPRFPGRRILSVHRLLMPTNDGGCIGAGCRHRDPANTAADGEIGFDDFGYDDSGHAVDGLHVHPKHSAFDGNAPPDPCIMQR